MEKEGSRKRASAGPLLLISHGEHYEKQCFYNVLEDKIDCASIPILHNKVVVGSSYGWLVLVDTDTDNCCLWNPECNEVIHLPPLPMSSLYTTCVLSKPPIHPACHILFNSAAKFEQAFCQIGDNQFVRQTLFENPHVQSLEAMGSSNGNLYGVVGHTERLALIHFTGGTLELCPILNLPISSRLCANFSRNYLIQCDGDELLIVRRMHAQIHMPYCFDFKVYRVDTNKLECAEVIDIGQRAIFVCRLGQPFCCSVSTGGGGFIKPNSIYYTLGDDEARDFYIFTLNNRSLTLLRPCPAAGRSRSRTSWIQFTSARITFHK